MSHRGRRSGVTFTQGKELRWREEKIRQALTFTVTVQQTGVRVNVTL